MTNETTIQDQIRLEASQAGLRLWRNNVGACRDTKGRLIRYGLANDSAAVNRALKSSDLIGIRPVVVTQEHVGRIIGQFVAREVKRSGWEYHGTPREQAQLRFIELVRSLGGDACFATGKGTL